MNVIGKVRERRKKYLVDRIAIAVEKVLKCSVIAKLPDVKIVNDCPADKLGYCDGKKICIDRKTLKLGSFIRDMTLCHEFIHWIGIDDETTICAFDVECASQIINQINN